MKKTKARAEFILAHLSDIHLSPVPRPRLHDLIGKRFLGYLNWQQRRKAIHKRPVLDRLIADLKKQEPDHIAVTGDLVNLALPGEFDGVLDWLGSLGSPKHVTAIPGNHDAYVPLQKDNGFERWRAYMMSDTGGEALQVTKPQSFPFIRLFGDIALIGLSTAVPSPPFIASGRLGFDQQRALGKALNEMEKRGFFRVVLIHHPPLPKQAGWRHALRDARALEHILRAEGAELVLHGHIHRQSFVWLEGVKGAIPIVGVPSASSNLVGDGLLARYNLFCIERDENNWQLEMIGRGLTKPDGEISEVDRQILRSDIT